MSTVGPVNSTPPSSREGLGCFWASVIDGESLGYFWAAYNRQGRFWGCHWVPFDGQDSFPDGGLAATVPLFQIGGLNEAG